MELTPERVALLKQLFEQALELPPAQRAAFLQTSRADPALREEVQALLAAHESDATLPGSGLGQPATSAMIGRRIGPWRVERLRGQGGTATVYEAVRADAHFQMRAAIKFLHAHARQPDIEQRFRVERQILASLDHPNVATLLDGGVTDDGQLYLVMEYIDGEPITEWAETRTLSRRARVELFLQVCAAVEAAHRNLIVHRDLKPGNILVTSAGRVKLLDFGIARLLGEVAPEAPRLAGAEPRSFTPSYAAPEQLRAMPVTTSTDIFSLGVVLFRLLTGRLPFAARVDPDETAPTARLEADLDAIIARALQVQSEQRYTTVQELKIDLERWLRNEPVLAHAGGPGYRLRKFLLRHRSGSMLAVVAMMAVLAAIGVASWQYRAARRAAADQEQVNAFLIDVLGMSDPFSEGDDLSLGDALDRAAEKIDERFADRPDLSALVRLSIGNGMVSRYRLDQAERQLNLAHEESIAVFGRHDVRTLRVEESQAGLQVEQGRLDEAETTYRQVIKAMEAHRLTRDPLYSTALEDLGMAYLQMERYPQADEVLQRSLAATAVQRTPVGPLDHAITLSNLAHVAHGLKDYTRAEQYYSQAEAAYDGVFPDGSPDVAILLNNHALLYEDRGDLAGALQMHHRSLAMRRKVFHGEHPMIVTALANVARLSLLLGDAAGSLQAATEGAAMADRVYTEPNRFHPYIHATLADAELAVGDVAAARASLTRARALLKRLPDAPPSVEQWLEEVGERLCARDTSACKAK